MRRNLSRAGTAVLLLCVVACASVGTGDPVVVRAEDALTNSLTAYTVAMDYHFKNSTKERVPVYRAFETFRVKFPLAWAALDQAKRAYQADKSKGAAPVDAALSALAALLSAVQPLIGRA